MRRLPGFGIRNRKSFVGLTSAYLVDPDSACCAEAVDTLALYSSAPKLLRRRMRVRGQHQSLLVSVAPVYLTPVERPDGIIIVVQLDGKDAFEPSEFAEAIGQRQFAALALIRCNLRNEVKRNSEEAGTPERPLPSLRVCVKRTAVGTSESNLSDRLWLPVKRLLQI